MSEKTYDVIVVGARCAGSPTAMLLARNGYDVCVVDRDTFPSDTLSTHMVHPPGVAALRRWGLLDRLIATGCPPIERYSFDFGPIQIAGRPHAVDGVDTAYGPRRTVLDKLLVDAAAEAGAEVREGFTMDEVLVEDARVVGIRGHHRGGSPQTLRARVVVGADGRNSRIAKAVVPQEYNQKAPLQAGYYTYWSGIEANGFEVFIRPSRGGAFIPTNDGLTLLVLGWPIAEFEANRKDVEGNYLKTCEMVDWVAERLRGAKREAPFRGGFVPNFFRKPFGPGWALVGDAGYTKDPITAMGISDAFRDAELCATALDEYLIGARRFDDAMTEYQTTRDTHALPVYALTTQFATMEPPPEEMQQLLGAVSQSQESMNQFVSVQASTLPVPEFFSEENIGRIVARASVPA